MDHFLMSLWHTMKSEFYMKTGDNKLSGWTEKKLQSKTCTKKKVMVTVWWSAVRLIYYYSFPNPSKTITSKKSAQQVDEIYQKLQCLQLALVNRKGPVLLHNVWLHITQPTFQKFYELSYKVLPFPPHLADLSTNRVPLLQASPQLFAGKTLPQPVGSRKCFLRVHRILKHGCLYYGNRQISVLLANTCWL